MYTSARISGDGIAVFKCKQCKKVVRDETRFFVEKPTHVFKVSCTACGRLFPAVVESRRTSRKNTNISGIYKIPSENGEIKSGSMTIMDISWQGFKLKVSTLEPSIKEHDLNRRMYERVDIGDKSLFMCGNLSVGELITIEFFLDDPRMSFIAREVYIRWIRDSHMGVELRDPEAFEPSIRFFLIGLKTMC